MNCEGAHPSSSKDCDVWKKEKQIQKVKTERKMSYPDGRKIVQETGSLWGSDHCDSRGRLFEEVFNDLNLCILNDGSPTYCHPASGSKSMLDLSVADPSLFLDLTWTVVDDLHGSDHFPVLVQFSQVVKAPDVGRSDFRNVNWDLYSDLCASAVTGKAVFPFTHLNCVQNHSKNPV